METKGRIMNKYKILSNPQLDNNALFLAREENWRKINIALGKHPPSPYGSKRATFMMVSVSKTTGNLIEIKTSSKFTAKKNQVVVTIYGIIEHEKIVRLEFWDYSSNFGLLEEMSEGAQDNQKKIWKKFSASDTFKKNIYG